MTPDTKLLGETIFKALLIVTDKLYHEADQTIVEKTMLDAGVKQSIFLSSLLRDDEKVEGSDPLPLMMSPIFVNLRVKKQDKTYIEGTISCFGYTVELSNIDIELNYAVEEFIELLKYSSNRVDYSMQ